MSRRGLGMVAALGIVAALAGGLLWARIRFLTPAETRSPIPFLAGAAAEGFARATGPQPLDFPRDHGPHEDYQTEWWYYTGNLQTAEGRHFGYQLTFFRRALLPPGLREPRQSDWEAGQLYLAHFAVTDVEGGRYQAFERYSRGAAGLAGAQAEPYRAWLDDWSVEQTAPNVYRLRAQDGGVALDLSLEDRKGPVLQGDGGYSRKGPEPGNASFYYSLTRLAATGTVRVGAEALPVTGLGWMDHEFSTSALGPDQVGWDWFALQLDDGSEIMLFQLRRADGTPDPYSAGTLIAPDGGTRPLSVAGGDGLPFAIETSGAWRSPHSGAVYPANWTLSIPEAGLTLEIEPYLADQELNVSFTYWEGAVRFSGTNGGRPVTGNGYVEMTGYQGATPGQFGSVPTGSP